MEEVVDAMSKAYFTVCSSAVVFFLLVAVVGLVGNLIVVLITLKKRKNNSTKVYVMALALVDMFTCVFIIPYDIYKLRQYYTSHNEVMCKIFEWMRHVSLFLSCIILSTIAVERYKVIFRKSPLKYTNRVVIYVVVMTLISLLALSPLFFYIGIQGTYINNNMFNKFYEKQWFLSQFYGHNSSTTTKVHKCEFLDSYNGTAGVQIFGIGMCLTFVALIVLTVVFYGKIYFKMKMLYKGMRHSTNQIFPVITLESTRDVSVAGPFGSMHNEDDAAHTSVVQTIEPVETARPEASEAQASDGIALQQAIVCQDLTEVPDKTGAWNKHTTLQTNDIDIAMAKSSAEGNNSTENNSISEIELNDPLQEASNPNNSKEDLETKPSQTVNQTDTDEYLAPPMEDNCIHTNLQKPQVDAETNTIHSERKIHKVRFVSDISARHHRQLRVAKMLLLVTGAFIVCWLPYWIITFCYMAVPDLDVMMNRHMTAVLYILYQSYFMNNAINPILYALYSREFRHECKVLVKTCWNTLGHSKTFVVNRD